MKTGFRGTFAISWSQTDIDGLKSPPKSALGVGVAWRWTGEAVRVDGPKGILPLGDAKGEADLRKRAARGVRRLLRAVEADETALDQPYADDPLFETGFVVTDGRSTWQVTCIDMGPQKRPLCLFVGEIPPRHRDLWVVRHNMDLSPRNGADAGPAGVVCFTPGTMIQTEDGLQPVETVREGTRVQTKDNGYQEILWRGQRQITGARLLLMPHLAPVRLMRNALGVDVPDQTLLVSPDHRIVLRGARARALFNEDEVLVTARDLLNDTSIYVDRQVRQVDYIHLMLPQHEIVFANGVETESFHPMSAGLGSLGEDDCGRLLQQMPELEQDLQVYGGYARRTLSRSDAAILRYDAA